MEPETRYARSGGLRIAYQVTGEGPDLVMVPGLTSDLEVQWRDPGYRRFVRSLSSFCRLVRFDKRGTGLSECRTARTYPVARAFTPTGGSVPAAPGANARCGQVADHLARQRPSLTCAVRLVRETGRPIAQVAPGPGHQCWHADAPRGCRPAGRQGQPKARRCCIPSPARRPGRLPAGGGRHVRQLPATPQVLNLATTRAGVPGHREQEQPGNTRATGRRCR
jgi:hypothetical protein